MTVTKWKRGELHPAAMNMTCSLVCLHPWSDGVGSTTPSGSYLSPENAIAALRPYLATGTEKDVLVLLLCAPSPEAFLALARTFSGVLPLPETGRMCRIIDSRLSLAITRMQRPAGAAVTLPAPVTLSTLTTRSLTQANLITQATTQGPLSASALSDALTQFRQAREKHLHAITQAAQTLQQKTCPVWYFSHHGDIRQAAADMQKGIPHPEQVFTAIMLFVGDDLSALKGAVHDTDYRSGA